MKNTKNVTLKSKIVAFQKAVDLQAETIKSILNQIILPNGKQKQLMVLLKGTKVSKAVKEPRANGIDVFLEALKKIGRPSTTNEIANRMRKFNPTFSNLANNKKQFMQLLYNNASQLSKNGTIIRTPISKRTFEYSLRDWTTKKSEDKNQVADKNEQELVTA